MKPYEEWLTEDDGLAVRLRSLRVQADLTGKALAAKLGWQQSKVSRLETGRTMPSRDDVRVWALACNAGMGAVRELQDLVGEVESTWLDFRRRARRGQAHVQGSYDRMVRAATRIRNLETLTVPGFLQTGPYARGVAAEVARFHGLPADGVEETVRARLARQPVLYEGGRQFELVVAESVLRQMFTSPGDMAAQLDRLLAAGSIPNVRLGVIPDAAPAVIADHSWLILDDDVIVETFRGSLTHVGETAASYQAAMDDIWRHAVEGDEARALIRHAMDALSGDPTSATPSSDHHLTP